MNAPFRPPGARPCPCCQRPMDRRRLGEQLDQPYRAAALGLDEELHSYLCGATLDDNVAFVSDTVFGFVGRPANPTESA